MCLTDAGQRPAVRRPVPRRPADGLRRGRAGVRPAAARAARGRSLPDPAPAGVPGRGRRQGAVRPHPDRPGQARRAGRGDAVRRWSSTPTGTCWRSPGRPPTSPRATCASSPCPTRGPETNDRGDVVLVDEGDVHNFVDAAITEQEAAAEAARDAPKPPPPLTGLIAGRYVVDVRNASEAIGLAGKVADHVREPGLRTRHGGQHGSRSRTRWCTTPGPTATPPTSWPSSSAGIAVDERRRRSSPGTCR